VQCHWQPLNRLNALKNTWFYGTVGFGGAQTFGGGSSPPALPLATGLPQYKPYETAHSNTIMHEI